MKQLKFPILITLLLLGDQLSKLMVVRYLNLNEAINFIPGLLGFRHLRNNGAAFSLLQNQQALFALITIVVLSIAVYYLWKERESKTVFPWALSLVIAGGLGNFIDRLRWGYVVDMLETRFMDFPIFNIADSYLSIGVFLLFIYLIKEEWNGSNH